MPIWSPDRIKAAASSALLIFRSRLRFKTRVAVGEVVPIEKSSQSVKQSTLTVAAPVLVVCDFNHTRVWRTNLSARSGRVGRQTGKTNRVPRGTEQVLGRLARLSSNDSPAESRHRDFLSASSRI